MKRYIFALFALILLTSFAFQKAPILNSEVYKYMNLLSRAFLIVQHHYVEPQKIDIKHLMHGALDGMLKALNDPYTKFLPPSLYEETKAETKGAFGGLGIEITIKDGKLIIISPIEGTPAERVGLSSGDWITHIDGKSTEGITLEEAVRKLRGEEGTSVNIRIKRDGEEREFKIVRERIQIKSVRYGFIKEGIGYIRISVFNQHTQKELNDAINNMKGEGLKTLILDLRNNAGGLLEEAVAVADAFIDDGLIVYTKGREEKLYAKYEASKHNTIFRNPIVVLINQGTASAGEIVAGALKDHGRAKLVGEKSFGKGSVQTLFPLPDGSGICLSTAYYYTPSGICIHGKGIEPHEIVEPLKLSKEQEKMIENLTKEEFLKNFVLKHRDPKEEDFIEFSRYLEERGIRLPIEILRSIVNRELEQRGWKKRALFDLSIDPQLRYALNIADEEKRKDSL